MRPGRHGALNQLCSLVSVLALAGCGGDDEDSAQPQALSAAQVCQSINGKSVGGAAGLAAVTMAASGAFPTYCKVTGVIAPKLNFEMRVPDTWNGKLYYTGGGGFNGSIWALAQSPIDTLQAVKDGYISVVSDSGHQGTSVDTEWAVNDGYAAQLWGSGSVPLVMSAAKEIVKTAYGQQPAQSYFEGCSNGGREGIMAMLRNPNLFDGVIIRSPAYNTVGFFGHWQSNINAQLAPGASLSNAKVAALSKAVRDKCDALDGVVDGVVGNQAACSAEFDPATRRCAGGVDTGDTCLSDPQLASLASILSGASFGAPESLYRDAPRALTGNDDDPGAWPAFITGNGNPLATVGSALTAGAIKGFIARDYSIDPLAYTPYDRDLNALFSFATVSDATSPDLRPFIARGGKVIFWHAGNDAAFPVQSTADYVQAVSTVLGKADTESSTRFYVSPGVNHCDGGPGADKSNLLAALDEWVVANNAPATLLAKKTDPAGSTLFERPLCRYPQYARYTGPANDAAAAKLASNFACTSP